MNQITQHHNRACDHVVHAKSRAYYNYLACGDVMNIAEMYCAFYCSIYSAPPYKVRCADKYHESELPLTQPQMTPTRPLVAFGGSTSSTRPSKSLPTTGRDGTVTCSPPRSPPLAFQTSDHNSQSPCMNDVTPTKQEKENNKQTPSSTSKYQRALAPPEPQSENHSKKSSVSIMEKFNAVYRTLTTQPVTEDELDDDSYSPVLERRSTMEVVTPSSGVLTRAPASPHITVTASDGRRVYLKMQQSKVRAVKPPR